MPKKKRDKDYIFGYDPKVEKRVPFTLGSKFAHSTVSSSKFKVPKEKIKRMRKEQD